MNESKWSTINNRTFIPLNFDPSEIARILWRFFPLTLSFLANSELPEPMSNTLVVQITHTQMRTRQRKTRGLILIPPKTEKSVEHIFPLVQKLIRASTCSNQHKYDFFSLASGESEKFTSDTCKQRIH